MLFYIITILLTTAYTVLLIMYWYSWRKIPSFLVTDQITGTPLSIIIPARNEENNIRSCIESILKNNYPKNLLEIIVVDDHSDDNTAKIVQEYSSQSVKLITLREVIDPSNLNSYKKKAIEVAVEASTGKLIITTDADCVVPENWLQTIAAFYEKYQPVFIAAPVALYRETNFLKIFQSLDFMTMQGITGAAVHQRFHTMCNGANMAYEKKVFYEVNGFKDIDDIASGDDMLLMHKIFKAYPKNILFLKSKDAVVLTKPVNTLSDFLNQRIRWASKTGKYTDRMITLVLTLVYLFNAWIFFMTIAGFVFPPIFRWLGWVLFIKIFFELLFLLPVASFFNKGKLLWWFIPSQPFHIIYILIAGWLGKFGSYKWKGRKVK
ncbi:glycosyltransferase [soil metagenome]